MHTIDLGKVPYTYNGTEKVISISERGIPFGTAYDVLNPKTGEKREFTFSHSTGPEFDPKTRYIFKHEDIILEIRNDAELTRERGEAYLAAKIRKS